MSTDHPPTEQQSARIAEMMDRYLGADIMAAFDDDDVTEIYVNPQDGRIWFDSRSSGKTSGICLDLKRIEQFLNAASDLHGSTIGPGRPQLQAELPIERFRGARLQGFLPPATSGPAFIVRKPPSVVYPLEEYVQRGILTAEGRDLLCDAIDRRWNILVAGGTGSGKTTFANALLREISTRSPNDRILILEDTVELQCSARDYLALRTTETLTLADLVRHTLRAYPDRIVVGEVRGEEALDLLDAWSTGHPGGLGTFHAQDATGALLRLDRLCQRRGVPSQAELIADAIDLLIVMQGGHRERKVRDIIRVCGLREDGTYDLHTVVRPIAGVAHTGDVSETERDLPVTTKTLQSIPK